MVYRIYAEKKPEFAVEAGNILHELQLLPEVAGLKKVRIAHRYDVEGISSELFEACIPTVFSEPPVDEVYTELPAAEYTIAVEYLPGQFDQRADSAAECIQLISQGERPLVRSATIYLLNGTLNEKELAAVKKHLINPVEARPAVLEKPETLKTDYPVPPAVKILDGFCEMDEAARKTFLQEYGLAMDEADLAFCQNYFVKENRQPTITELRMLDTYWSDHCRHTTFATVLQNADIKDEKTLNSYNNYLALRKELGREHKPQTLMDIATIGAKAVQAKGGLAHLDESEEVNACSVKIKADNGGKTEDWLLLFKNETHNHPTEIEPFGGAATCIGGAIRDPLANRGYVFGAMRVTGAGNPLAPLEETLPGKLPQRKICVTAAQGYSSYGNQIGLATGLVHEVYHPGYVAKRMELGAVVGAVKEENVRRETPQPGDIVILLGGRTGRDGCGGATGSSKAHTAESLETCGAEVQKGNPPVERRLQRLFRTPAATKLIIRCNDFGAGGVSVAIGELADGLDINLDAVPKKYDGLDGTELAISESQERMAVVIKPEKADEFIKLAEEENLEATKVAVVTQSPRLVMRWRGNVIADISREFLNSNGAEKQANVQVKAMPQPVAKPFAGKSLEEKLSSMAKDLRFCSQKGLSERFDSTIGSASVRMPFGGKHQLSPAQALVMKLPVDGETTTCAGFSFGYSASIMQQNPYTGAYISVVDSVARLAAAGFKLDDMALSFQEYFPRLGADPARWGMPFAALLGALQAQVDLGVGAIGGKDSMSGSFEDLDVPPTLVSFAAAAGSTGRVPCGEFQVPGSKIVWLRPKSGADVPQENKNYNAEVPNAPAFKEVLAQLDALIASGKALAVYAVGEGGAAEALFKMALGNHIGVRLENGIDTAALFAPAFGSFIVELEDDVNVVEPENILGETTAKYVITAQNEQAELAKVQENWEQVLEAVYPYRQPSPKTEIKPVEDKSYTAQQRKAPKVGVAKPRALVPVFPGTNCEYDTARALRRAGAEPDVFVVRNLSPAQVAESAEELARRISQSQMLVLPGGFSAGDEPEGSAKLITAFLRGARVANEVQALLSQRDGLVLGICNGFQALVKLGLLPYGEIRDITENDATLTFNAIGRHQSMLVRTRIASNLSPWLSLEETGAVHTVAISHGEGRFMANSTMLESLAANGQIAAQYVDLQNNPTMDVRFNPNGSTLAIEAITSPDGRVLGKMGHSERSGESLYINVPGNKYQKLFEGGVSYFNL